MPQAALTQGRFGREFSSSTKPPCKTTVYCQLKVACCSHTGRLRENQPGTEEEGRKPVETSEPVATGRALKGGGLHPEVGARGLLSGKRSHSRGWFEGDKRATWLISRYPHEHVLYIAELPRILL